MLRHHVLLAGVVVVAVLGVTESNVRGEILTHDYEFNGNLNDSLGGPSLVSAGGTITPTSYDFGPNQGLSLSSALASPGVYTIDMSFSFTDLTGYRKILDFKNLTSDNGLYNLNSALNFFPVVTGSPVFSPNGFVRVDLTRDASNTLTGYVNGSPQFSFADSSYLAPVRATDNIINFFIDDTVTSQGEASGGSVNQIRLYDGALTAAEVEALGGPKPSGAVPEPAGVILLGTGLCGLLLLRGRHRATQI